MVDVLLDKVKNFPWEEKVKVPKKAELVIGGEKIDLSAWLLPTKQVGRVHQQEAIFQPLYRRGLNSKV